MRVSRHRVTAVTGGLAPAPQRHGVRTGYTKTTLRETLWEFQTGFGVVRVVSTCCL
jgi:hypothetical protein